VCRCFGAVRPWYEVRVLGWAEFLSGSFRSFNSLNNVENCKRNNTEELRPKQVIHWPKFMTIRRLGKHINEEKHIWKIIIYSCLNYTSPHNLMDIFKRINALYKISGKRFLQRFSML
jgi:hypothetical protein